MITALLIAGGFALLTYTSRLAETRRAGHARARERVRRPR
jgi:hypothetical protein